MPTKKLNQKIQQWRQEPEPIRLRRALTLTLIAGTILLLMWLFILLPLQFYLAPGSQTNASSFSLSRVTHQLKNAGQTLRQFIAAFQNSTVSSNRQSENTVLLSPAPSPSPAPVFPIVIDSTPGSQSPAASPVDGTPLPSNSSTPESPSPSS